MGFGHKTQELSDEINLFDLARLELFCRRLPKRQVDGWQWRVAQSIPHTVKISPCLGVGQQFQKGFQLGRVCFVILGVDLPHKGLVGPNGPNQRVLTPHKVEVTSPKQAVKVTLAKQWQV